MAFPATAFADNVCGVDVPSAQSLYRRSKTRWYSYGGRPDPEKLWAVRQLPRDAVVALKRILSSQDETKDEAESIDPRKTYWLSTSTDNPHMIVAGATLLVQMRMNRRGWPSLKEVMYTGSLCTETGAEEESGLDKYLKELMFTDYELSRGYKSK